MKRTWMSLQKRIDLSLRHPCGRARSGRIELAETLNLRNLMKTQIQSFIVAWSLIAGRGAVAQTAGNTQATNPDDVRAAVYNYNNPLTGKEVMGPAGPLPAQGWFPSEDDVLNVRKLGAKGDGVTDDTEALQAIFKKADNGQVIFFPAGKYLISDTLKLNNLYGVQIVMHGGFRSDNLRTADCRGIFWSAKGPEDRPMLLLYNCSWVTLEGLKLDGGGRAQDGLILDTESSAAVFKGDMVHIRSCARYGLRIATWRANHPVGGVDLAFINFSNSRFTGCGSKAGQKDANVTVESGQSLLILFDTCHFSCSGSDYLEYNVYMRGGQANFLNCSFGSANTFADIYIGENYTATVNASLCHSEGITGQHYFLYVDNPQPSAVGACTLERIGTGGKVFFNAANTITISNSALYDVDIPCPDAKVVLFNDHIYGKLSLGTKSVFSTNVVVTPR